MRPILVVACIVLWSNSMLAQISVAELKRVGAKKTESLDSNGWKKAGLMVFTLNQSARSDWSTGGENFQIGMNLVYNQAIHHRRGPYTFDFYFDMELGVVEASSFKEFRKTNDRFDMTMEFEHDMGENPWSYGVLANINTQIFNGYDYYTPNHDRISAFLSPGKFLLSPGFDFKDYSNDHYFSLYMSPITFRLVTKFNDGFLNEDKFGVDAGRRVVSEFGAYISLHYNKRISAKTNYIGRLDLFSNYRYQPKNIDLLMNNLLTYAMEKKFALSLILDILYDHDIRQRVQLQEIFGIGLRYQL